MVELKQNKVEGPYRRLIRLVAPYRSKMIVAGIFMIIVAGCNGLTTWLIKPVVDDIFVANDRDKLVLLSIAYPAVFLVKGIFQFLQAYIMGVVGQQVIRDIRIKLFRHVMSLDQRFFHRSKTGELASRVSNDVSQVQAASTKALTGAAQHFVTIIVLTVVIFSLDWQMAIMAIIVFPLAVFPLRRFGRMIRHYSKKGQENIGALTARIVDAIKGVRVIQVFQMEDAEVDLFAADANRLYLNRIRRIRTQALSSPVMELLGTVGLALTIFFGGNRVIESQTVGLAVHSNPLTPGEFFSFIASLMLLYDPIKKLNGLNASVNKGAAAAERIFELLDTQPCIVDSGTLAATNLQIGLELQDIVYEYQENRPVLRKISLTLPKGHTVALVGPSGAGKSTIADLVPRFLDPDQGRLLWDGIDCKEISVLSLRSKIAMVDQQTVLFNASLRDNLSYAVSDASEEQINQALVGADMMHFIESLPEGLNTVVGEDGVQLSGGQRQRLAIARAILKDAPLLILDEATSSLDTASEQAVQHTLERLMVGRTSLLIAHRLSTVKNADKIIVLEDGQVVEEGDFNQLMAAQGLFSELVAKQSLAAEI